jgi:hypothetical protein
LHIYISTISYGYSEGVHQASPCPRLSPHARLRLPSPAAECHARPPTNGALPPQMLSSPPPTAPFLPWQPAPRSARPASRHSDAALPSPAARHLRAPTNPAPEPTSHQACPRPTPTKPECEIRRQLCAPRAPPVVTVMPRESGKEGRVNRRRETRQASPCPQPGYPPPPRPTNPLDGRRAIPAVNPTGVMPM